jgi:hypothetical protein
MQFLSEWERNEDMRPVFKKAYEVVLPRDIKVRHEAYWLVFHLYELAILRAYDDTCVTNHLQGQKRGVRDPDFL